VIWECSCRAMQCVNCRPTLGQQSQSPIGTSHLTPPHRRAHVYYAPHRGNSCCHLLHPKHQSPWAGTTIMMMPGCVTVTTHTPPVPCTGILCHASASATADLYNNMVVVHIFTHHPSLPVTLNHMIPQLPCTYICASILCVPLCLPLTKCGRSQPTSLHRSPCSQNSVKTPCRQQTYPSVQYAVRNPSLLINTLMHHSSQGQAQAHKALPRRQVRPPHTSSTTQQATSNIAIHKQGRKVDLPMHVVPTTTSLEDTARTITPYSIFLTPVHEHQHCCTAALLHPAAQYVVIRAGALC
jgi:hypothetical protein